MQWIAAWTPRGWRRSSLLTVGAAAAALGCGPQLPDAPPPEPPALLCEEGALTCSGTELQSCVDGMWQLAEACGERQLCDSDSLACVDCPTIEFSILATQSCALDLAPGVEVDAEAFIPTVAGPRRLMAMDRWGDGHLLAWCDSSSFGDLLLAFDVMGYLGQVPAPRVASFGDLEMCDPQTPPDCQCTGLPTSITYLGTDLPATYKGNAAKLAQDWDVLLVCGFHIPWANDWSSEVESFVAQHGKGLAVIGEYDSYITALDFTKMTDLIEPTGIRFQQVNLDWATADADVVLECVPGVPLS